MSKVFIADKETLDKVKQDTTNILGKLSGDIGGGGIAPDNMKKFMAVNASGAVKLYIEGPSDTVIDSQTVCSVKGVRIVRSTTAYPETEKDGEVILELGAADLDKYASVAFNDADIVVDTTYYYGAFPYSDNGVFNRNEKNRTSATPKDAIIYGYRRKKSDSNPDTCIEYTDEAVGMTPVSMNLSTGDFDFGSWKDTFLIRAFRPVALKYDGTVDYELDHDDQTKKLDGTASDISSLSYGGNFMVEVKPIWIHRSEMDGYEIVKFSDIQVDNTYHCYQNMNDGGEVLDAIYLPMFEGSNVSSKVRSIAGQTPMNTTVGATEIIYAQNNGSGWYLDDWSNHKLIEDLLYLLAKSTASQAKYGNGHYSGGSQASHLLQTGTLKNKGMFYGTSGNAAVKVFWLENYYGDRWDRTAGAVYGTDGKLKVKMYPPYNTDGTGYINTGVTFAGTSGGYISDTIMTEYGRLPKTASGSDSTYVPDGLWWNTSQLNYALSGGYCYNGLRVGVSCLYLADALSASAWVIGPSLSYKKPAAA